MAGDKKPYADRVGRMLGVPEGYRLISLLAIGYPARPAKPKAKRALGEVLHWERF